MSKNKKKSLEDLEKEAIAEFSDYAGEEDIAHYEEQGVSNYETAEDDYLNFGDPKMGAESLLNPEKAKTVFKFTLTNADTSNTKSALLGAPDFKAGKIVEGSFKSVDGSDVFSASGKRKTIDEFNSIITDNPGLVSLTELRCSDTSQFAENLTHFTRAFSKRDEEEFIDPQIYESKNQYNPRIIEIMRPMILGPDNWLEIPVIADTTVTVTLFFTALENRSSGFMRKIQRLIRDRY